VAQDGVIDNVARPSGTPFKRHYDLEDAQPIDAFVDKMARGMCEERVEVLVTAFCLAGTVLTTRAAIGTENRSARVSVLKWRDVAEALRCDEVRQYHNHPGLFSCLSPSYEDSKMHRLLALLLEPSGARLRSFVVKARLFGGWRIREYSDAEWRSLLDARRIGMAP